MINRSLFNLDRLVSAMLDTMHGNQNHWIHLVEIIPDYMPPFPSKDTRPTCVVKFKGLFLRYSAGPRQGFFWDAYGDDMHCPEMALLAVVQAPVPPCAIDKAVWREANEARLMAETPVF
jgi:hypothetical protein